MRVLLTGSAYKDVILRVDTYPVEDTKKRCLEHAVRWGGNASNTAFVLAQQTGIEVDFFGVFPHQDDKDTCDYISYLSALPGKCFISLDYSIFRPEKGGFPVAYIIESESSHTRTIINHRNYPSFTAEQWRQSLEINGQLKCDFDWLHFEGTQVEDVRQVLALVETLRNKPTVSVEIEKPDRAGIEDLIPHANVVFFSRVFAISRGYENDPSGFLTATYKKARPDAVLIVTWGAEGAYMFRKGKVTKTSTDEIAVVETVGAGDTFIAGMIYGLMLKWDDERALSSACRLATRKCQRKGFNALKMLE